MIHIKKYSSFYKTINEKVRFFDENGNFFSTGNNLSSIEQHIDRFGKKISFSVDGYDGVFYSEEEFNKYKKEKSSTSIFPNKEEAYKKVLKKRKK